MKKKLVIIGAGIAGISAALTAAEKGQPCILVSEQPSERSQSVLAEGGISGEIERNKDAVWAHWKDTVEAGCNLADPNAVWEMVQEAPAILEALTRLGVPFQMEHNSFSLRKMGGHRKKRTAFAGNHTGKAIMTALIDELRRWEAADIVERLPHHVFEHLLIQGEICEGCVVRDRYTDEKIPLIGSVILACGGLSGLFKGHSTGTKGNDGSIAATVFYEGVELGNLEFIQFHPTAIRIPGKMLLISEAARSEGGRLYIERNGKPWYFLEERYGKEGNLVARDIAARNVWEVSNRTDCKPPVYLDMTGIKKEIWEEQLTDLKEECEHYLNKNPEKNPIPVEPAIHYFMGGILVDQDHRTNKNGLYAAGECACQYHGANRLGGNSLLGAFYGGQIAAKTALNELEEFAGEKMQPARI